MAISLPRVHTKPVLIISAILLVVAGGLAVFFYKQYTDLKNSPDVVAKENTARLLDKVGKLYALPGDEDPTVAEVSDKSKVKDQPFFKNVENGDHVLVYPKSRIAILYRESQNKIINVGPVAIDSAQGQTQPQAQPQSTVKP
jgi:hypothetical protein